jgi:type VI secretion system protein ImpK
VRLLDYFIPFLAYLRHFQSHPAGDAAGVQRQLDELLVIGSRDSQIAGVLEAEFQEAKFAAVALADEIIMGASWVCVQDWKRQLLQRRYFNISNAGVAFFEHLAALPSDRHAVREVYVYCMYLGFAGRYGHDRDPKTLSDIKAQNLKLLMSVESSKSTSVDDFMFPQAYSRAAKLQGEKGLKDAKPWRWSVSSFTASIILVPVILLAVLYGVYHFIIWQTVNSILAQIK